MRPCRLTSKPSPWCPNDPAATVRLGSFLWIARSICTREAVSRTSGFAYSGSASHGLSTQNSPATGRLPEFSGGCPDCKGRLPQSCENRAQFPRCAAAAYRNNFSSKFDIEVSPILYSRCRVRIASRVRKDVYWLTYNRLLEDSKSKE